MLIAEDLLVLLTHPDTGKLLASGAFIDIALAGGVLNELAQTGNARVTEKGEDVRKNRIVVVSDAPPPSDSLLAESLARLATKPHWSAEAGVNALTKGLRRALYDRLVRAELVRREDVDVLGLTWAHHWPAVDATKRETLRRRLRTILLDDAEPEYREAALIGLVSALGVVVKLIANPEERIDKSAVKRRAKVLKDQYWASDAVGRAIAQAQAAAAAGASVAAS